MDKDDADLLADAIAFAVKGFHKKYVLPKIEEYERRLTRNAEHIARLETRLQKVEKSK